MYDIDIDNAAAMREAVDHVVDQGCRDVAYVGYGGSAHWNLDRWRGVRSVLSDRGIGLPRHRVLTSTSLKSLRTRLPGFLTNSGVPEAVITSSDSIAVSVTAMAATLGIRVGKAMAVTGFDDGPLTTMVSPEITSVAVAVEPIADQLLDMLERALPDQLAGHAAELGLGVDRFTNATGLAATAASRTPITAAAVISWLIVVLLDQQGRGCRGRPCRGTLVPVPWVA